MTKITIELDGYTINRHELQEIFNQELEKAIEAKRKDIEDLLDLSIKTGTLITLAQDQLRAIGKTSMIIERANELGATVVFSNKHMYDYVRGWNPEVRHSSNIAYVPSTEYAKGIRFVKGFMVDEGVDDRIIKELIENGNKLLGGFKRL